MYPYNLGHRLSAPIDGNLTRTSNPGHDTAHQYQHIHRTIPTPRASTAARVGVPGGVGGYISCSAGVFASRTIRAEVNEIQRANVGRKYVSVLTP